MDDGRDRKGKRTPKKIGYKLVAIANGMMAAFFLFELIFLR